MVVQIAAGFFSSPAVQKCEAEIGYIIMVQKRVSEGRGSMSSSYVRKTNMCVKITQAQNVIRIISFKKEVSGVAWG